VPVPSSNEAMAVQIGTEDLLLLIRMQNQGPARKLLAESHDGGQTRDSTWLAQDLATPMCQSSILRQGNKLYHCGPADTAPRSRLLLQKSENFGQSWEPVETIWMGSAAYCDVVAVAPDIMGVFYERQGYSEMVWTQIVLDP
jgi:sialidase-1